MKFNSDEERLQHPQAGIIPEHVWTSSQWNDNNYWNESRKPDFPNELIPLIKKIQKKPTSLLSYIKSRRSTLRKFNKKVIFIVVLSYSNLKFKSIHKLLGLLNISEECFFNLCAKVGNVELIKVLRTIHSENWIQERIKSNDYEALRETISRGYLKAFSYLAEHIPDVQKIIASSNYEMFRLAAFHGDTLVLSYLIAKLPDKLNTMIEADSYYAFRFAAANGHLEVLQYLSEKRERDLQTMIAAKDYYSFRKAAGRGHLTVVQYLIRHSTNKREMIASCDYFGFRVAAERGHESVVHFLLTDPEVFAYAEHKVEFEHYILPYVGEELTSEMLQQELQEFVWQHFQEIITKQNYQSLSTILQKKIARSVLTTQERVFLSTTNISKTKQKAWLESLQVKYGEQEKLDNTFLLKTFSLLKQESHFIRFSYLNLDQLLKVPVTQNQISVLEKVIRIVISDRKDSLTVYSISKFVLAKIKIVINFLNIPNIFSKVKAVLNKLIQRNVNVSN